MSNQVNNLEAVISKISFEIVNEKILERNEIDKLLGVLANDGVYAMWVYALDKIGIKYDEDPSILREEKLLKLLNKIAELDTFVNKNLNFEELVNNICQLTIQINLLHKEIEGLKNEKEKRNKIIEKLNKEKERNKKLNEYFINLSLNIHKLLFLKQLLEKTLIYARYHARAMGD